MIAFASNSLLCRAALKGSSIDPATFTFVRIFSGALALWLVMSVRKRLTVNPTATPLVESFSNSAPVTRCSSLRYGNWISAVALFAYAAGFSVAYTSLSAGTGALLLFGAVQATMILRGLHKGERLNTIQIAGFIVAGGRILVVVFHSPSAPPLIWFIPLFRGRLAPGLFLLRGKRRRESARGSYRKL